MKFEAAYISKYAGCSHLCCKSFRISFHLCTRDRTSNGVSAATACLLWIFASGPDGEDEKDGGCGVKARGGGGVGECFGIGWKRNVSESF